jgi:hypothetical protein
MFFSLSLSLSHSHVIMFSLEYEALEIIVQQPPFLKSTLSCVFFLVIACRGLEIEKKNEKKKKKEKTRLW